MAHARTVTAVSTLCGLGLLAGGCASEPGTSSNNVKKEQITINDLLGSASDIGQSLAADVENLVRYDFGGERVVLYLGDIDNRTGTVSTNDFLLVQEEIRAEMFKNRYFRDNVQLRERGARTSQLSERERGGSGGPLGGSDGFQGLDVDPDYVFFLNGDARKLERQDESGFFILMSMTRESTGEMVWQDRYFVQYGG